MKKIDIFKLDKYTVDKSPCVYFLFDKKELVYIGKTHQLNRRISYHQSTLRYKWDSFSVLAFDVTEAQLSFLEAVFITKYKPKYNSKRDCNSLESKLKRLEIILNDFKSIFIQ